MILRRMFWRIWKVESVSRRRGASKILIPLESWEQHGTSASSALYVMVLYSRLPAETTEVYSMSRPHRTDL